MRFLSPPKLTRVVWGRFCRQLVAKEEFEMASQFIDPKFIDLDISMLDYVFLFVCLSISVYVYLYLCISLFTYL